MFSRKKTSDDCLSLETDRCRNQRGHFQQSSDRKSTRLNSSHLVISYAVFCLKKKEHTFVFQTHYTDHLNHALMTSLTIIASLSLPTGACDYVVSWIRRFQNHCHGIGELNMCT